MREQEAKALAESGQNGDSQGKGDDDYEFLRGESVSAVRSQILDDSESSRRLERVEADKEFGDQEEKMKTSDEFSLPVKSYAWEDKYRPRKPRYYNRVRTGYDWNKYNQTHYDHDNPPPKFIFGYKFNIFYPDLIDPTVTPRYFLEPCNEEGFVVLRFHAGPPYEDIAFYLIYKLWDQHKYSGFRCVFERGVLQLHFNFKRQFYRR